MKITGLKPGKEVGEILIKLLDMVIDCPELNDRNSLLNLISQITK
jgi:hypothetical protein